MGEYTADWKDIDMTKDQHLMSIRKEGRCVGHIEIEGGELVTSGEIGHRTYNNFVELIMDGLSGHDLAVDHFFT